jgi:hypothetical protein
MNDWKLLLSRVRAKVALTAEDLSYFTNAIHIYLKRLSAINLGLGRASEMEMPISSTSAWPLTSDNANRNNNSNNNDDRRDNRRDKEIGKT